MAKAAEQKANQKQAPRGWLDALLSENPSKRSGEKFLLLWSVIWIGIFAGIVVSKVYEVQKLVNDSYSPVQEWGDIGYMACGLLLSVPNFLLPNIFVSEVQTFVPYFN